MSDHRPKPNPLVRLAIGAALGVAAWATLNFAPVTALPPAANFALAGLKAAGGYAYGWRAWVLLQNLL